MDFVIVGFGAALGAVARYFFTFLLPHQLFSLMLINVMGSAIMGYVSPPGRWGKFWTTGFLGGFTSFATFSFLVSSLSPLAAASYVLSTLASCIGAWWVGDFLRRRRNHQ